MEYIDYIWSIYGNLFNTISFILGFISGLGVLIGLLALRSHASASKIRKAVLLNYFPVNILGVTDRKTNEVLVVVHEIKEKEDGVTREVYDLPQGAIINDSDYQSSQMLLSQHFGLNPNDFDIKRGTWAISRIKINKLNSVVEHPSFVLPWLDKQRPRGKAYFLRKIKGDIIKDENNVVKRIGYTDVRLGPTSTIRAELLSFDDARTKFNESRVSKRERNKLPILARALDLLEGS